MFVISERATLEAFLSLPSIFGRAGVNEMSVSIIGLGYVGLSLSVLLSQKFKVFAVDVDPQKVDQVNNGVSPIVDTEISDFLTTKHLDLTATLDFDICGFRFRFVVIATPTDYDVATNSFDTSSVSGSRSTGAPCQPGGHYHRQVHHTHWLH